MRIKIFTTFVVFIVFCSQAYALQCLDPIAPKTNIGRVFDAKKIDPVGILVSTEKGLFRLDGDTLTPFPAKKITGFVYSVKKIDPVGILVSTEKGLFRLDGDTLTPFPPKTNIGRVYDVKKIDPVGILVSTEKGLFRLDGDTLTPFPATISIGTVYGVKKIDSVGILVSTEKGLFRLDGDTLTPIAATISIGTVYDVRKIDPVGILVNTERGLFRLDTFPVTSASAIDTEPHVILGQTRSLSWRLKNICLSSLKTTQQINDVFRVQPSEVIEGGLRLTPENGEDGSFILHADDLRFTRSDKNVPVQLETKDSGAWAPLGKPIEVHVSWTATDYMAHYLKLTGPWILCFHTLLFLSLIIGARWSAKCWALAVDPIWGRFGLWFYFALRHSRTLQLWVLERWFVRVRARLHSFPYLAMPLSLYETTSSKASNTTNNKTTTNTNDKTGTTIDSVDISQKISPNRAVWIQGNAGMGKTILMGHVFIQYFCDPSIKSLRQAYRKNDYVPILISLREYSVIKPKGDDVAQWITELARIALKSDGLTFPNATLLDAILSSLGVVLLLDGANEVDHVAELELYAKQANTTGVVVTSQTLPQTVLDTFQVWRLPDTITDAIKPLLTLYLGEEKSNSVENKITPALRKDIQSGYDVRLLADLVEEQSETMTLPEGRIGLYDAILTHLHLPDGKPYPLAILAEETWKLWCQGVRKFTREQLTDELLAPLIKDDDNKVVRSFDGTLFEFRHDQMRGYLAARWVAVHEVSPITLFEKSPAIWRFGRSEHEVVWGFFSDLVSPEVGATVWKWATREPERVVLQHAMQRRGEREGWIKLV